MAAPDIALPAMPREKPQLHTLMSPGDNIVAARRLYGVISQFKLGFAKFGWRAGPTQRSPSPRRPLPSMIAPAHVFVESIANPGGIITDVWNPSPKIAHDAGVPLIVDNTLASPFLIQPHRMGADIVVHSATKFLGGHGNSMAGVIVDGGKFDWGLAAHSRR